MSDELREELAAHAADSAMAVDAQIEHLRKTLDSEGTKGVMVESAILTAVSTREAGAMLTVTAGTVARGLQRVTKEIDASTKKLTERFDTFEKKIAELSAATDRSSQQMARWTKVMAWATIVLAAITALQIVISAYQLLHPDTPQLIFMNPPRP